MSRITNAMLTNNYLGDLQTNLRGLNTLQDQLSSGKTIQRASENVSVATKVMQLNSEISANEQFGTNITDSTNWSNTTDTALSESGSVLSRIRELMVKAGNGSYSEDEISAIKDEITSAVGQLGQVLNTSYDGNYVFGGTKSTSKPVTVDSSGTMNYADPDGNAITDTTTGTGLTYYNQISSDLKVEISEGVKVKYNVSAADLLEFKDSSGTSVNTMSVLSDIIKNLGTASDTSATSSDQSDALTKITGTNLDQLDTIISNFSTIRSNVGTMQNRLESAAKTNEDQNYNMTSVLSDAGDIDVAEKTVEYSTSQTIYKAALQISSSVLTKTIMDYL